MSEFFCPMPFLGTMVRSDGVHAPCCKMQDYDLSVDARIHSLEDVVQSPHYKDLRAKFLANEKPVSCKRCWNDEASGVLSYRQKALEQWGHLIDPLAPKEKIKVIEFAFGNICNAACIICDNGNSSLWYEDSMALEAEFPGEFKRHIIGTYKNSYADWTDADLSQLEVLIMGQSETFAQPELKNFLKRLKAIGHLSKVTLEINTNGSLFPNTELLDLLLETKFLDIQISVDGVGEQFEYLRYPLKWSKVDENTRRWHELTQKKDAMALRSRFTFSALNIFEFDKVQQWWQSIPAANPKVKKKLNFGHVSTPAYLRPQLVVGIPGPLPPAAELLFKSSMREQELAENRLRMLKFLNQIDKRRNKDVKKLFPEIFSYLETVTHPFT